MLIHKINGFIPSFGDKEVKHKSSPLKYVLPLAAALVSQPVQNVSGLETDIFAKETIESIKNDINSDEEKLQLLADMEIEFSPNFIRQIMSAKTITIDPGHGGKIPSSGNPVTGTKFKNPDDKVTYYEKDVNLAIAKKVRQYLIELGTNVVMTRDSDSYVDLEERVITAQKYNSDVFLSIHADNSPAKRVKGATIFKYEPELQEGETELRKIKNPKDNELLAKELEKAISGTNEIVSRGVWNNDYKVLRESNVERKLKTISPDGKEDSIAKKSKIPASVLLETGFLSNPDEAKLLITPEYQDKIAKAIVKSLVNYSLAKTPEPLKNELLAQESTTIFNIVY